MEFKEGDRVKVFGIGVGTIAHTRNDDRGDPIHTVNLDNSKLTSSGYILARNCELKLPGECALEIPDWMTLAQYNAVSKLYARGADGSDSLAAFLARVENYHDYCGLGWCGMFIGIEKDGYTHS